MGNKFGNFKTADEAASAIAAEGFELNERGFWTKMSKTSGNLMEAPRKCKAIVEITSYRVDGKYADDGKEYQVYQHHFVQ